MVVASGGEWIAPDGEVEPKLHLHWRLKQPTVTVEGHALLLEARRSVIMLVDCDPTNAPISHPIRWPGSWHRKGHPKLASLVSVTDHEIDLNAVLTVLRGLVRTVSERRAANSPRLVAERPEEVAAILDYLPNLGGEGRGEANYDRTRGWYHWNDVCLMTYAATQGSELGRLAFHKWSAKSGLYNELTTERKWAKLSSVAAEPQGSSALWSMWRGSLLASTLEQPPDWLKAEMEKDRGKGASTHPSDNRFGRVNDGRRQQPTATNNRTRRHHLIVATADYANALCLDRPDYGADAAVVVQTGLCPKVYQRGICPHQARKIILGAGRSHGDGVESGTAWSAAFEPAAGLVLEW